MEADSDHLSPTEELTSADAWDLLLAIVKKIKGGAHFDERTALSFRNGTKIACYADPNALRGWSRAADVHVKPDAALMLDLYMPLCVGALAGDLVVAHLGQSLDGRIATHGGVSQFITGDENLLHTHRMRALFDAVLVGAHTASNDNPKLTTRLVKGTHPARIIIDPQLSVTPSAGVFTDGKAKTIVVCRQSAISAPDDNKYIALPAVDGIFQVADIIAALHSRGLRRIFIEGGGITVSRFLQAGALHRLHVCVAPMIIGSGRPAFQLPVIESLSDGLFPHTQHFSSGDDILFDCQLQ